MKAAPDKVEYFGSFPCSMDRLFIPAEILLKYDSEVPAGVYKLFC